MFTTKVVAFKGLIIAIPFKSDEMGLFTFEIQDCFLCLKQKKGQQILLTFWEINFSILFSSEEIS